MSGEFQRAFGLVKGYVNREWERINAVEELDARRELRDVSTTTSSQRTDTTEFVVRDSAHARRILDVAEGADYEAIKTAYETLSAQSKPDQFVPGTVEHTRAIRIQRSIHTAFTLLIEEFGTTERRFKSLEID